jgi:hypothetical protein
MPYSAPRYIDTCIDATCTSCLCALSVENLITTDSRAPQRRFCPPASGMLSTPPILAPVLSAKRLPFAACLPIRAQSLHASPRAVERNLRDTRKRRNTNPRSAFSSHRATKQCHLQDSLRLGSRRGEKPSCACRVARTFQAYPFHGRKRTTRRCLQYAQHADTGRSEAWRDLARIAMLLSNAGS